MLCRNSGAPTSSHRLFVRSGAPLLAKASEIEPLSAVLETAALPLRHAPWNGRLESNQRPRVFNRISLHAIKLCRLSYARICSACRLDCHASCALEAPQAFQAATHWLSQGGRIPTAVFSGHCHLHVSHAGRSHIVRALPGLWYHTALRLPTSHQELGNYTSRLILSFLRFLARLCGWCGIAVLPCFSASGEAPVTRGGLPLRGTYAAYMSGFHGYPTCLYSVGDSV